MAWRCAAAFVPGELGSAAARKALTDERWARITIEARWARYYDFGAGRVPGFMQKLTEDRPAIHG